jgi:nucleoside-diphosphate-sugar epimerase
MARILIAGCGYVGGALAQRLVTGPNEVWGLRRRPMMMPLGVEPIEADLAVARTLRDLPPRLDFVIYGASPAGPDDAHYRTTYVEGVKRLLEALHLQRQSPRRIFLLSSTSVFGQSKGEWVDESSATEPVDFRGTRVLEGESILAEGPFAATILRLGGIYGPRRTSLVDRVRTGRASYRKGAPRYTNRIHRDDIVGVLEHLMNAEAPAPLYVTVDDEPAEDAVVLRWLAGILGAPEPRAEKETEPPTGRAATNKRCRNDLLRASGYAFRFPTFREGYTALVGEAT